LDKGEVPITAKLYTRATKLGLVWELVSHNTYVGER